MTLASLIDGLLLGAGRVVGETVVVRRPPQQTPWLRLVADNLRRWDASVQLGLRRGRVELVAGGPGVAICAARWRSGVPRDLVLNADALAYWFAGAGSQGSEGYAVRLSLRRYSDEDAHYLAGCIRSLYRWDPVVTTAPRTLRLVRSGDRLAFRRLVVGRLPACCTTRLNLRESRPCSVEEAVRRRRPQRLDEAALVEVRRAVLAGEPYAAIAARVGVSARTIGKVARGALHPKAGAPVVRRRASPRRLSCAELAHIHELARKGLSQRAIATQLRTSQSRISRALRA